MGCRSDLHRKQLAAAREWCNTPEAKAKRSTAMKARWAADRAHMMRGLNAARTPEALAKKAASQRRPLAERFNKKWRLGGNGCWVWRGAHCQRGYGQMRVDGRTVLAAHVSLELAGRPRPWPSACSLHSCDNPPCVNPEHLRWGTLRDNAQDAMSRGRADLSGLAIGHEKMRALRNERPIVPCEWCGTEYQASREQVRRARNYFCCNPCSVAWQKAAYTGKPKGSWRVSP